MFEFVAVDNGSISSPDFGGDDMLAEDGFVMPRIECSSRWRIKFISGGEVLHKRLDHAVYKQSA